MLISYRWLKELLPDLNMSAGEVAEVLTKHSFATEVAGEIKIDQKVLVAQIVGIKKHPYADRLRLVTVDVGGSKVTVICGADNISVGDVVPYAPVGTRVKDEQGSEFVLRAAKIRGVESVGMLNSPRELGLSDWQGGIYILPRQTPVGDSLANHIEDDIVLEADITPNRAHDCLNHLGIAREVAAVGNIKVAEPKLARRLAREKKLSDWNLQVENKTDTPCYRGILLSQVTVAASPLWLQARLWAMKARPINNVVDMTNYVMFELGNPTHAFDAAQLPSKKIGVRRASLGEYIVTLDGERRKLSGDDLVITSGDKPIALAGVMGGIAEQVSTETKDILLEAANFRAYLIQETSSRLKIESESAARFKKGLSPAVAEPAAARAVYLLTELAGAKAVGVVDSGAGPAKARTIAFNPKRVSQVAGIKVNNAIVKKKLKLLRGEVEEKKNQWQVKVPLDRLDLVGQHDLIEEVIRLVGLDKIPSRKPAVSADGLDLPAAAQWRESTRTLLVNEGFTEMINYSFEEENICQQLEMVPEAASRIKVQNPPALERSYLRQSLLPQLISNLMKNRIDITRKFSQGERALFEIGQVFMAGGGGKVEGIIEKEKVAAVVAGSGGLDKARQAVKALAELIGRGEDGNDWLVVGTVAADLPVIKKFGLAVAYFEFNLDDLVRQAEIEPSFKIAVPTDTPRYQAPSKFPAAYRDLSILVDPVVTVEQIEGIITRVGGELMQDVDLFDVYQPAGQDKKGLAFHLAYQSKTKTLTEEEVAQRHNEIVATLRTELGVQLRE